VTLFPLMSDPEVAEAIDRLDRLVEKLGRDPRPVSRGLAEHHRCALDEARTERERQLDAVRLP